MHFASHLRSERLGEFTIGTELHRSESLALVQLLILYHLVTATASVALGGAGTREPENVAGLAPGAPRQRARCTFVVTSARLTRLCEAAAVVGLALAATEASRQRRGGSLVSASRGVPLAAGTGLRLLVADTPRRPRVDSGRTPRAAAIPAPRRLRRRPAGVVRRRRRSSLALRGASSTRYAVRRRA